MSKSKKSPKPQPTKRRKTTTPPRLPPVVASTRGMTFYVATSADALARRKAA